MLMLLLAAVVIGIASSTAADRAAARARFRRFNAPLWILVAAIWAALLAPW